MDEAAFNLWVSEAQNDFTMGDILFAVPKFNGAVFYFVQAAEKAIKGLLYYNDRQAWGHSLVNLLEEYEEISQKDLTELKKDAQDLEPHYAQSRYPDASPGNPPKDAYNETISSEIREKAKKFMDFAFAEKEESSANE